MKISQQLIAIALIPLILGINKTIMGESHKTEKAEIVEKMHFGDNGITITYKPTVNYEEDVPLSLKKVGKCENRNEEVPNPYCVLRYDDQLPGPISFEMTNHVTIGKVTIPFPEDPVVIFYKPSHRWN